MDVWMDVWKDGRMEGCEHFVCLDGHVERLTIKLKAKQRHGRTRRQQTDGGIEVDDALYCIVHFAVGFAFGMFSPCKLATA